MTDDKPGDPTAVRHLRPQAPLSMGPIEVVDKDALEAESEAAFMAHLYKQLNALRAPFPPDMIEKLPKPTFKNAWDGGRASRCNVCHGYHVQENCIHLDYVGHANVTNRLLEVDPMWYWEPMALTEQGTPLFSDGGLWIKLTVCGVTRLGYGDGKSVKEVIGDAIRNAAMRFGVALDLWAKIDLHAERNPGDGDTPAARASQSRGNGRPQGAVSDDRSQAAAPPPPNQDALDSLGSVCDSEGIDRRAVRGLFDGWLVKHAGLTGSRPDILEAPSDLILAFARYLLEQGVSPDAGPDDGAEPADTRPEHDVGDGQRSPGGVGADAGGGAGAGGGGPAADAGGGSGADVGAAAVGDGADGAGAGGSAGTDQDVF